MSIAIRRAGDVTGTPAWQEERMFPVSEDVIPVSSIKAEFDIAAYHLGQAVDHLVRAASEADHYGKSQMIDDLIQKLDDDIPFEMSQIIKKLKEGS